MSFLADALPALSNSGGGESTAFPI